MFYFVFCAVIILSMFGLLSALLRCGDVCRFVAAFYPCEDDSDKYDRFDQWKI